MKRSLGKSRVSKTHRCFSDPSKARIVELGDLGDRMRAPLPGDTDQEKREERVSYGGSTPQPSAGFGDAVSLRAAKGIPSKTFALSNKYGGARPKTTQARSTYSSPLDVVNMAQQSVRADILGAGSEIARNSTQYLHELVLHPIFAEEVDEWFTQDE
ncbi:MAG: hypothetical protein ACTJLK_00795 [Anaplasma sp.]